MDEAALDSALSLVADCHSNWTSNNILIPVFSSLDSDEVIDLDLCQTLRSPDRDTYTTRKRARRMSPSSGVEFPFEVRQASEHSEHSEHYDCYSITLNHYLLCCYYLLLFLGVLADEGLA